MALDDPSTVNVSRAGDEGNIRASRMVLDLPKGRHTFEVAVYPRRQLPLRIEIVEVPGSPGRAVPANE